VAVLGVDGWRGRWVGARLDGRSVELMALDDVAAVLAVVLARPETAGLTFELVAGSEPIDRALAAYVEGEAPASR
jgi:uncharacterized protein YbjT (DUF2867 family)